MNLKAVLLSLCVLFTFVIHTDARIKVKKTAKSYIKLVDAYNMQIIPGMKEGQVINNIHFIIVWEGTKHPDAFGWYANKVWQPCTVQKAHRQQKLLPAGKILGGSGERRPSPYITGWERSAQ